MRLLSILLILVVPARIPAPAAQDIQRILDRAEGLLEEAKSSYGAARSAGSVAGFIDAGFKLEEARIKYLVLQEIGQPEQQKLAADRLRAVNQLSKLIHDGKAAISGRPADPSAAKPPEAAPADPVKDPVANPVADVTKRIPVPDPSKTREAEKLVRDLFQEHYAKKSPGDRKALARLLLDQAARTPDDPAGQWVLYREAQDAAAQGGDYALAADAVEAAARVFDVDALSMKAAIVAAAAKLARTPEEFTAHAEAALGLIDELVRSDQFDSADKTALSAVQSARRSNNAALIQQAAARSKDVAEAKLLFQSLKAVMETLAKNADDAGANLEMGRFLCFVKGNWDLGLRFMAKGSDAPLKALAAREIALSLQAADRVALADGWHELGGKEKSALRKSQLMAHARDLYESALPDASTLLRAKIEKRLAEDTPTTGGSIDLLRMIDPKLDAVASTWSREGELLKGARAAWARLQVPYRPPEEYDFTVSLTAHPGDTFIIGLVFGGTQFMVVLDSDPGNGGLSGFDILDGKKVFQNPASVRGQFLLNRTGASTVVCSVRKGGVTITINGKKALSFQGESRRLALDPAWRVPDPKTLFLAGYEANLSFSKAALNPVTGQGRKIR